MDIGLEFHDLLLVVFVDVDIHRFSENFWQICDLYLPVDACKGFKVEFLYAQQTVPHARRNLCAVDWLQIDAGDGDECRAGSQVRGDFRGRICNRGTLGVARLGKEDYEIQ